MRINVIDKGRHFSAEVNFAVFDCTNSIIALSIGGLESTILAITAGIIEGRRAQFETGQGNAIELKSYQNYRKVVKKAGDHIFHGLLIHKSAVFNENHGYLTVIAPDGDIKKTVGTFLAKKFALPMEWVDLYYSLIPSHMIEDLEVYINPLNQKYRNMIAVKLSSIINEEFMVAQIDKRLKDGRLKIPHVPFAPEGKFDPSWTTGEYLKANAEALAGQLGKLTPRYNPQNPNHKLNREIALMKRTPFPVQAQLIQGIVNTFNAKDGEKAVFCGGDLGTGKSITALGIAHLMHKQSGNKGYKVLLVAPGITIPKWIDKEIKETLPWAKTRVIRSYQDALKLLDEAKNGYEPDTIEFILVGTDRAKLGPEPWCGAIWKRVNGHKYYAWHCPDCGEILKKPKADEEDSEEEAIAGWDVLAFGEEPEDLSGPKNKNGIPLTDIPTNRPFPWKKTSQLKKCQACGASLWRPASKKRGEARNKPRWYVSRILKRLGPWFDLMIQDEVHQTKAQDSGRGDAFAQMVKSAKRVLMLTGTLVNGKSTSIKEILWRTDPQALLDAGFDHKSGMVAWASRYGVLKRVIVETETDTGVSVRKKKTELQPTEEVGIAPQMTTQFLLHKTAFMELADLGLPLVEKKEIPVFIDMDEDHASEYKRFHESLYEECRTLARIGVKGAWSKFIPATINYADRPDLGGCVQFPENCIIAPEFEPDYYNAKERWLVDTVRQELSEGRGVMIYNKYTDGYKVNERVQEVLKAHGISSAILKSSTSTEARVEWLKEQEAKGQKVIITNMRLVEVGLDCLYWPTIINYQMDYDINVFRQANGRNWRIGQHRECRIYIPILNGTQQVSQFQSLMAKRAHALIVEGRLDRSELSKFGRDSHNSMASDIANCIANAQLSNQWQELAARDIDVNLKLVSEEQFKSAVAKAMKELQSKTMELCDVTELERKRLFKAIETSVTKPKVKPVIEPASFVQATLEDFNVGYIVIETVNKKARITPGQMAFNW